MAGKYNPEEVLARFDELTVLESEFEDVEAEIIRKSAALYAPLYKKRSELAAKLPHFWALVFEQSPPEVDNFIQPSDSRVFAECLETLEVSRFELDDPNGSPRSFSLKFGFGDNEYFQNKELEKKFWFRKSLDGWQGLVSEPIKINWKKDKDLTDGLTDAAYNLHQAKAKLGKSSKGKETDLPEYKALVNMIDASEDASNSFFAWFGFVSSYKWVSAEESVEATKKDAERLEKQKRGEHVEDDDDNEDDMQDMQETEVFLQGDELATIIAEDMWPSAVKYYKNAHEADEEDDLSEVDIDDLNADDDEDSGNEIDIRALVGKPKNATSDSPPKKKQRKS